MEDLSYELQPIDAAEGWYELQVDVPADQDYEQFITSLAEHPSYLVEDQPGYTHVASDEGIEAYFEDDGVTFRFPRDEEPAEGEAAMVALYLQGDVPEDAFDLAAWLEGADSDEFGYDDWMDVAALTSAEAADPRDNRAGHPGQPRTE